MIEHADQLVDLSGAQLDKLFESSHAGTIPVGRGRGTVLFATGRPFARPVAKLAFAVAWQGKIVADSRDRLKNLITPFRVPAIVAMVYSERSWLDDKDCTVLDYSKTSTVAKFIRDEIREVAPNVYLGIVYWGRRRVLRFSLAFDD